MHASLEVKKTKAFTLLEMIIALGIFSMLSVCMAAILSSSLSAYRVATNKKEAVLQASTAMEWLLRDIGDNAKNLTELGPNAITLDTNSTTGIRYWLNTTDNTTMRRRDNVTNINDTLAEGVTGFNLQYYDINNAHTTNSSNVSVVEIYINTTSRDQTFRGYTVARFAP